MIEVNNGIRSLKVFANKIPAKDVFGFSSYTAYRGVNIPWLMKKFTGKTIEIDLTQTEEDILKGFKSNTRNEVRKGIKEGFEFSPVTDIDEFVCFYNAFADEKKLFQINREKLACYPSVKIYKAVYNRKALTMHATVIDEDLKIARLLYSASVRFDEVVDRKNVGISNRYLHYMEFIEFKRIGLEIYDFGGINEDERNVEQFNITQFKKGFGGVIKDSVFLTSPLLYFALWVRKMIIRNRH